MDFSATFHALRPLYSSGSVLTIDALHAADVKFDDKYKDAVETLCATYQTHDRIYNVLAEHLEMTECEDVFNEYILTLQFDNNDVTNEEITKNIHSLFSKRLEADVVTKLLIVVAEEQVLALDIGLNHTVLEELFVVVKVPELYLACLDVLSDTAKRNLVWSDVLEELQKKVVEKSPECWIDVLQVLADWKDEKLGDHDE